MSKHSKKIRVRFSMNLIRNSLSWFKKHSSIKRGSKSRPSEKLNVIKTLQKRYKLIKIADKSPGGWDTVKEYQADSVASDTEDEKKLKRAEKKSPPKDEKKQDNKAFQIFINTVS